MRPTPTTPRHASESGEGRLWVVWLSSALAALLLTLGVSGTLGDWTSALVQHDENTAATRSTSRVLQVTGPDGAGNDTTCSSVEEEDEDNQATCEINLFGEDGVDQDDLAPGSTSTTVVTVTNTGDSPGVLSLDAGACNDSNESLCDVMRVSVTCLGTSPMTVAETSLTAFGAADPASPLLDLAADGVNSCTFATRVPVLATGWSGQSVAQTVSWTLTDPDA